MGRRAIRARGAVVVVVVSGCSPEPGTSAAADGTGSPTSTAGTSGTGSSGASATSTTANSTGVDLECPEENVHEGDLTLLTGDDPMTLYGLTEIRGDLSISSDDIVDLSFLSCLRSVERIFVSESSELENFEGLEQLTEVLNIYAFDNPRLESLHGLDSLREIRGLGVWRNPSMTTIGLDGLESAVGIRIGMCSGFSPEGGPGLTDIVGLSGLRGEINTVDIEGNEELVSLEGLRQWADNGVTITTMLRVRHNRQLPTAHAEEIVSLLVPGAIVCGNEGDEGPWDIFCECDPAPPEG